MRIQNLLMEYVQFDPVKLKARLEQEADYLTGNDTRDLSLLRARLTHWTKPGDERFPKWLQQFDPSPNNKYVNWMINRYLQGGITRLEDFGSGIVQALKRFEELKNKKKLGADADINKLKGLSDLNELIRNHEETSLDYDAKEVDVILDSDKYSILSPKTHNASKALACDTDWCTAFPDMYRHYSKKGPLYIISEKGTGKRWQFHFESEQFMDERDTPLPDVEQPAQDADYQKAALINWLNDRPEVAEAFSKLGKFKTEGDSWIFPADYSNSDNGYVAYDIYGLHHRDNGPAIKVKRDNDQHGASSSEVYFYHGQRHREGGPAKIRTQGDLYIEHWYEEDMLHRDPKEGPAIISYLDTDDGEIDPNMLDTRDSETAAKRYERWYGYWERGEELGMNKEGGPLETKQTDESYDRELQQMLNLAGVGSNTNDPLHWPLPNAKYRGRAGGPLMSDRVPRS